MTIQYFQLADDFARSKIRSLIGTQLKTQMYLIDDKLDYPLAVEISGDTVQIEAGVKQKYTSDGTDDGVSGTYKWRLAPLNGADVQPSASTLDLTDGSTTGDFANNPATGVTMTAGYHIQMGIELRDDGKHYVVWGDESATSGGTTFPRFNSDALSVMLIRLEDSGSGGSWNFNTPDDSDVEIMPVGGGAGGGGDTSFKLASMSGSSANFKKGYIRWDDGIVLAAGDVSGSGDLEDFSIDLTDLIASPDNSSTYWMYIDITKLPDERTYTDNGREVYPVYDDSHFVLRKDMPFMNPSRFVFVGGFKTPGSGNTWVGSEFWSAATRLHTQFGGFMALCEVFEDTSIDGVSASVALEHGFNPDRPQLVEIDFYDDSTGKQYPLLNTSHVLDINTTNIVVNSLGLTFDSGDYLVVKAYRLPELPNTVLDATRVFRSSWYTDTSTTQEAHGLDDKHEIVSAVLLEWDVVSGTIREIDQASLVKWWDDDNIYYDWTGLSPSANLKYRVITSPTAQPYAKPFKGNVFTFTDGATLTNVTTAFPCDKLYFDFPFSIRAVQKMTNGWQNVDNIGALVWVTDDVNKYLRGDISSLSPTSTYPVKIMIE